jgi:predicted acylesterase/phospholipase RssA
MSAKVGNASAGMVADRPCDIVMEGGAASGIVYPRAIVELSRRYRFQRIGGTSAGAVAAAAAAAAEYGRRVAEEDPTKGNAESFDLLSAVPDCLKESVGGHTRLRWLFEPERRMRPAYELFMALVSAPSLLRSIGPVVLAAARHFPASFVFGAATGLLLAALAVVGALRVEGWPGGALAAAAVAAGVLATVVLAALGVLANLTRDVALGLPKHHFGVARGYSADPDNDRPPRVTNWMYRLLQDLAGKPMNEPLTFGDLERYPDPKVGNENGIALRLMTTCLTQGRPYRLPFADDEAFCYKKEELQLFFPAEVLEWMEKKSPGQPQPPDGYLALPRASDFPVVVAVRMSMAFPLFFSSIPLYAFDRTRHPQNKDRTRALEGLVPERCWFADGGICSNLPVHFFDRALPRWPTFALDLRRFHRDLKEKEEKKKYEVWMDHEFRDKSGKSIITEWWEPLPDEPAKVGDALGFGASFERTRRFVGAVIGTAMDWNDNAQLRPIGSRDRVAHVSLSESEGSFNLVMESKQIFDLAERGRCGGAKLRDHFAYESGWRDNRSARLFSFLAVTGEYLQWVSAACNYRDEDGKRYYIDELDEREEFHPPGCAPLRPAQSTSAEDLLRRVLKAADEMPGHGTPASLVGIEPPPRQTIRFLPEGEGEPFLDGASGGASQNAPTAP